MIDFLLGVFAALFVMKVAGYATITWLAVFAPIYLPVLLVLLIVLIAAKK